MSVNDEDQYIKVIIKLNRDTASEKVKWYTINNHSISLPHDGEIVGKVYRTPLKTKSFQIFRYKYQSYSPDYDSLYYTSSVKLEIVDERGNQEWEFPNDNTLNDLYETVRFKSNDVDSILSSFLKE